MGKNHLMRLAAPKTWHVNRKKFKFIAKPSPGAHSLETCMPLSVMLIEVFDYAHTKKEVRKILNANEVKIDGKFRKDFSFGVGIFDTMEFVSINEYFRVILNKKGKIDLIKISKEESLVKPCKIIGKSMVKGKLQLNLFDGKNIIVDKGPYKVGDSLVLSLPEQKIVNHLKLEKKSSIFLTGGKHIGETGNVEDIIENKIIYKDENGSLIETSKDYAFVIRKNEPDEKH